MYNLWKLISFTRVKIIFGEKMKAKFNENNEGFLLTFDLPRELLSERKRINLELKRISAKKIQFSIWKSEKLEELMRIAIFIKQAGGNARILEEKFIF